MTISAKIITDSISSDGTRLTTMQLRYPRFIHSEFMTHRVFSRNASSSRAIPVSRLIDDIIMDTAKPIHWGKNQKGMQADEECNELLGASKISKEDAWLEARDNAIKVARAFNNAGYHKQIVNRLLEPFSHINVLVTATEWNNFYELRRHKDAQPEIHELADVMYHVQSESIPKHVAYGAWHTPYAYGSSQDEDTALKISAARCARVSYLTQEGKIPTVEEDIALFDRLMGAIPFHASPTEHQATPTIGPVTSGNFKNWLQFRHTLT